MDTKPGTTQEGDNNDPLKAKTAAPETAQPQPEAKVQASPAAEAKGKLV